MAQVQGEEIYLVHSGQEVDDNIDEVVAARGSEASLSARLADIVSDFETDQQRQDDAIAGKAGVSTFDITLSTAITASEYSYSCITTGDIVTVCFRIVLASGLSANTSYTLFQLPSGTYPRITVAGTGYADSKVCTFWLNTSGQIRFTVGADALPSGASINANFCFSYKAANWTTVTPASLQSVSPALMQAGRIDAELTDAGTGEEEEER